MIEWGLVFLIGLVFDSLYVLWNHFVSTDRTFRAAATSTLLTALGMLGTLAVVNDPKVIVPQLMGVFAGTYAGMKIKKRFR